MGPAVIVAGHVCLDVIPSLTSTIPLAPGRLIRVGAADVTSGGAVANTGLALHRLGVPVRLMGTVADDLFGHALLDVLRLQGQALADGMRIVKEGATSYSIVVSPPEADRTFLHCPGVNESFTASDVAYDRVLPAKLFHFGYPPLMPAMCANDGEELVRMFQRVRSMDVATSLDMSLPDPSGEIGGVDWPTVLKRVLPYVDVFLPSLDEILFMLDRKRFEEMRSSDTTAMSARDWAAITTQLLDMGATVAGLKLGELGLFVQSSACIDRVDDFAGRVSVDSDAWADQTIYSPCFRAKEVAGTTGSGDCTIAGYLAAITHGLGPIDTATYAAAVGACSVEAIDATSGVPSWEVVHQRIRRGWPRQLIPPSLSGAEMDSRGTYVIDRRIL